MLRIVMVALCLLGFSRAHAQEVYDCPECYASPSPEIHHHEGATAVVDRFYSTWFKPDKPTESCCNKVDFYPTQVKFEHGQWHALRREDQAWLPIPPEKIEQNRDSPDGRSHVCAPSPKSSYPPLTVFCFVLGVGG
jgi:hypothetical protein